MNRFLPILVIGAVLGLTACGGDDGAKEELERLDACVDKQQAEQERMQELHQKELAGTITTAEKEELDELYAVLEQRRQGTGECAKQEEVPQDPDDGQT